MAIFGSRRNRPVFYDVYFWGADGTVYQLREEEYHYRWYGQRADRNLSRDEFQSYLKTHLRARGLDPDQLEISIQSAEQRGRRWVRPCHVKVPVGVHLPRGLAKEVTPPFRTTTDQLSPG